jgi:hypothetical protein
LAEGFGEGRVISREMVAQWQEALRVSSEEADAAAAAAAAEEVVVVVVVGGRGPVLGSQAERPPSLVSTTCWCVHCEGDVGTSGASTTTPVATDHSHCSGNAEGEGRLARKTWHPHVEQKYLVDVGEAG